MAKGLSHSVKLSREGSLPSTRAKYFGWGPLLALVPGQAFGPHYRRSFSSRLAGLISRPRSSASFNKKGPCFRMTLFIEKLPLAEEFLNWLSTNEFNTIS
jgi:hypothetical protein